MKLPEIKRLATEKSAQELEEAAQLFEEKQENRLNVQGDDEGEVLTHLLLATRLRKELDQGRPLSEVLRELSASVRNVISSK